MSIKVVKPGLHAMVVDGGRSGFRSTGIGPGGAMDMFAMTIANYLVGNDKPLATIEIHFPGPELLFQASAIVCVAGKGLEVKLNDRIIPMWKPVMVSPGAVMKFEQGGRVYLATHGGWKADQWLGSYSTHAGVKAGGYHGRALQANDTLALEIKAPEADEPKILPWGISPPELSKVYDPAHEIRYMEGPEMKLLDVRSREALRSSSFTISSRSNRMGYRLESSLPGLTLSTPCELVSSPVDFGTIQCPPDGKPIILMADHQTTGGYPRIASVIRQDLPKLAQMNPGEHIKFRMVSFMEAESILLSMEKRISELKLTCLLQFRKHFQR